MQDDLMTREIIALGERMRHAAVAVAVSGLTSDGQSPGALVARVPSADADLVASAGDDRHNHRSCKARTVYHWAHSARYRDRAIVPGRFGAS